MCTLQCTRTCFGDRIASAARDLSSSFPPDSIDDLYPSYMRTWFRNLLQHRSHGNAYGDHHSHSRRVADPHGQEHRAHHEPWPNSDSVKRSWTLPKQRQCQKLMNPDQTETVSEDHEPWPNSDSVRRSWTLNKHWQCQKIMNPDQIVPVSEDHEPWQNGFFP